MKWRWKVIEGKDVDEGGRGDGLRHALRSNVIEHFMHDYVIHVV